MNLLILNNFGPLWNVQKRSENMWKIITMKSQFSYFSIINQVDNVAVPPFVSNLIRWMNFKALVYTKMLKPHQYFLNSVSLVRHAICMLLSFLLYTNTTWSFFLWIWMDKYNQYFLNEVEYCTRAFHFVFLFFDVCVQQQHSHCYSVTMCTWITSGNLYLFLFLF